MDKKKKIIIKDIQLKIDCVQKKFFLLSILGNKTLRLCGLDIKVFANNSCFFLSKCSLYVFFIFFIALMKGLVFGYFIELSFIGLGYKFLFVNNCLLLKVGYSHYIQIEIPNTLYVFGYKKRLIIFGIELNEINNFINKLRLFKRPDIYKGKGICFLNEKIKIKVGKQKL